MSRPIIPIILSGGEGSRLWPVSRRDFPKQFASLVGESSLFQQAVQSLARANNVKGPIVVAGAAHEAIIREQLAELSVQATILIEPEGRDSGPAVLAAAILLSSMHPDCVAIMQPADHYIPDLDKFRSTVARAAIAADQGRIVTFGVTPTEPNVAYGYIAPGHLLEGCAGVSAVKHFAEKPSKEIASAYIAQGYLWNSGIFVFRPSVLCDEMATYAPDIVAAIKISIEQSTRLNDVIRLEPSAFSQSPRKSLDHAVMERTSRAAVVLADFEWSDLGAWGAIYSVQPKDEHGNAVSGESIAVLDSANCLVRSSDIPVAVIGARDLAVVVEPDGIVVCALNSSASVKTAVEALRSAARPEVLRSAVDDGRNFKDIGSASLFLSRWLDRSALPLWWAAGADHERGGFLELLDQNANAVLALRRLRVQARQVYVFADAGYSGWVGPWKTAVRCGLDYLKAKYRRSDGFYRTLVDSEGAPVNDAVLLYDQAFVLLALAAAAKSGIEFTWCTVEARNLLALLREQRSLLGGFSEQLLHGSILQSNPHMHLLEAALAWREVDVEGPWGTLSSALVQLCLEYFVDGKSGVLREFFDEKGRPVAEIAGRTVEPGHQFEWSWLLTRWFEISGDNTVLRVAERLHDIGETYGVDLVRNVAVDALLDDMMPYSKQARLWPQTERLKSALALARNANESANRESAQQAAVNAARGLSHYLRAQVPGLWRDKMRADGTFVDEPSPASSLYHISVAISELKRHVAR